MERNFKSRILVAIAVLLAFALATGPSIQAGDSRGKGRERFVVEKSHGSDCVVLCHKPGTPDQQTKCLPHTAVGAHMGHGDRLGACDTPHRETILGRLLETDGAQALVATVLVVDEATAAGIADRLGDPYANWILFAPTNGAFEALLGLEQGDLDGLSIETIAALLPSLLDQAGVSPEQVLALLLKHVADNPGDPKRGSEDGLLRVGEVTVVDLSVFPISVGRERVAINYEAGFSKPDVFTGNGVIHFLDNVILDTPPPPDVVEVFATSGLFDGNLGGLAGADQLCTTAANDAGGSGNWTAWLSINGSNARDRIIDAEYQLLDGTVIARDLADLTDGMLAAAINLDESLNTVTGDVWTATDADGTWPQSGTCAPSSTSSEPWTSNDPARSGGRGSATETDSGWTRFGAGGTPCSNLNRLYCFAAAVIPGSPDETNVCSMELCALSTDLAAQCEEFLDTCLIFEDPDECVPAAALFCREL